VDDQATPQVGRGSGQIAADRVLDVKRFCLPLRLFAAAPAGPPPVPTGHRRADGRTPPDTRPRRHGPAAGDPR
jgi:hypothetical protein